MRVVQLWWQWEQQQHICQCQIDHVHRGLGLLPPKAAEHTQGQDVENQPQDEGGDGEPPLHSQCQAVDGCKTTILTVGHSCPEMTKRAGWKCVRLTVKAKPRYFQIQFEIFFGFEMDTCSAFVLYGKWNLASTELSISNLSGLICYKGVWFSGESSQHPLITIPYKIIPFRYCRDSLLPTHIFKNSKDYWLSLITCILVEISLTLMLSFVATQKLMRLLSHIKACWSDSWDFTLISESPCISSFCWCAFTAPTFIYFSFIQCLYPVQYFERST